MAWHTDSDLCTDSPRRARTRRVVRAVAASTSVVMLLGVAQVVGTGTANASVATAKRPAAAEVVTERPDAVSAMLTARAQGSRVENLAARTEFSTSWANPDGTITTDEHAGAIRYRDASGVWRDVDLNLQAADDGSVAPKRHARGLRLSGKTTKATDVLVAISAGTGREVALGWSKRLPTPTVDGDTATYAGIGPGVDMNIQAQRAGFEQTFTVHALPADGSALSWDIPLRIKGLTARMEKDGSISFLRKASDGELAAVDKAERKWADADGKAAKRKAAAALAAAKEAASAVVVSTIPAAVAWDAALDPRTGDHVNTSPVRLEIITGDQLTREKAAAKTAAAATAEQPPAPAAANATVPDPAATPAPGPGPVAPAGSNEAAASAAHDETATAAPMAQATATATPTATAQATAEATAEATTTATPTAAASGSGGVAATAPTSATEAAKKSGTGTTKAAATKAGRTFLRVTPNAAWMSDPVRKLPITVDPTYASGSLAPNYDAFVQQGYTSDQSPDAELKLGNNGSGQIARSLLRFPTSGIGGYKIMSASLNLYATHSWSCSARPWEAWSISAAGTSNTWTNQPAWWNSLSSTSATKGYSSSCAAGWVSAPVTAAVQWWADAGANSSATLGLRASDESDPYGWKKFSSANGSHSPYISYTYDRRPGAADAPGVYPAAAYAPPGGSSAWYVGSTTPAMWTRATDPDGDTVAYNIEVHQGGTSGPVVSTCTTPWVASAATASCTPSPALADNTAYAVRAYAGDPYLPSIIWSPWTNFYVAAATPAAPSVTCPAPYGNGSWADTAPTAPVTCTVAAPGSGTNAPGYVRVQIVGSGDAPATETQYLIAPGGSKTFTVSTGGGSHVLTARAETPAGILSAPTTYQFGYGLTTLSSPAVGATPTTVGTVRITGSGPPKAGSAMPTPVLKWRVAGSGADAATGWTTVPAADAPLAVTDGNGTLPVSVTGLWDAKKSLTAAGLSDRVPVLVETQLCLVYTNGVGTQCTWTKQKTAVQYVPHAFGNGFPTAEAGPGQVALWTGEFNTDTTDVSVPGYTGDLSISRSHSTYAGAANPAGAVFGPGWTAGIDGSDAGVAGMQVIDSTRTDATLALIGSDGSALVYTTPSGLRRTTADLPAGTYVAADSDTALAGARLRVAGTGAATTVEFTSDDGAITTFAAAAAPVATADAVFVPATVTEAGVPGQTDYTKDSAGRITQIRSAAPGVTCTPTTRERGCRALDLTYTTIAGQTRLAKVSYTAWDPELATPAMRTVDVAQYTYETTGAVRLLAAWDPQITPALKTTYTYGAGDALATITPAGLAPFTLTYTGTTPQLDKVSRPRPGGGTTDLATIRYVVPLSGTGLPDLRSTAVTAWNQAKAPTAGRAVFGPDHPVTGTPGDNDWPFAELSYTDELGYTVNTAAHGAGAWQLTATDYDTLGNVTRTLDAAATLAISTGTLPSGATADQLGTMTVYNAAILDGTGNVLTPAGALVTDTYGPARWAVLSGGSNALVRPHTAYAYDQGAPAAVNTVTGLPYRLATTTTVTAANPSTPFADADPVAVSVTKTGYEAIETGDTTGWALGAATSTITAVTGTDLKAVTRYDGEGRVIETRQPKSAAGGTTAGVRKTTYYTAGANPVSACANTAEWAGLVCQIAPGDGTGSALPTTTITSYNQFLAPTVTKVTSGSSTRTTTTRYRPDGRLDKILTSVTGLSSSTPVTDTATTYDPGTGLVTDLVALDGAANPTTTKQSTGYDSWGRTVTYTVGGDTTTTTYDTAGRVATVTDPQGTTTTTYDGTDAANKAEHRGLPTTVSVTNGTAAPVVFTGSYNAAGALALQKLPGGITQSTVFDNVGQPTGLSYTGRITTTNPDGSTTVNPDGPWLAWTQANDVTGRVRREWTPSGNAFTAPAGQTDPGAAISYDRQYRYDQAGRLTQVDDLTSTTTANTAQQCEVRRYTFDANGNRSALTRFADTGTGCPTVTDTTTGGTDTTYSFNDADQLTASSASGGAYTYDPLGRATSVPVGDTPKAAPRGTATGDLTIGYYDTDAVRTLTQDGTRTTYDLDVAGRRATATTGPTGGTATSTLVRHYADGSDNPAWVEEIPAGATGGTITRYAGSLGGDLTATITGGAVTLPLANLHGDTIATVDIPTTGPALSISAWSDYDEYGSPRNPTAADAVGGPTGYGWLGAKERASDDIGLMLMGARLYNPTTGQFTSVDPVRGGGATAYAYPTDPVNTYDLDGKVWDKIKNGIKRATGYNPTSWLGFKKQRRHFVMRDGRPGIHWGNPRSDHRIEWDKHSGWHYNHGKTHHNVWTGIRAGLRYGGRGLVWVSRAPIIAPVRIFNRNYLSPYNDRNRFM